MKTYIFLAEVEEEEDGRWSAWVEALPGCAVWGYTKEEALAALQDAAQAYIEVLKENGREIPVREGVETLDTPAVAVNV
jgi:predicted RNase H-like HicB family nuclease